MAFKLLTGPYLNHLTRCASTPAMTPSALTLFPATNALDNRSSRPAIFGTASSDSTITVDLNLMLGEFESSGQTATWTMLGVGSIAATSGDSYSGSYAALLTPGGGASEVIAYKDVTVRSGEALNLFAAAHGNSVSIRLRNRQTGNWLSTGSTWDSSIQQLLYTTSTSWVTLSQQFSVEPLSTCITDTVQLRVYLQGTDFTNSRFDQVELWPSLNWCSIHGHNIPPAITPMLEYSTDNSTWTTHSTMTLRRDSFYVTTSTMEAYRYWRVRLDGVPDTTSRMFFGEVVMGQSFDVLHNPVYGGTLTWTEKQTRLESDLGEAFIFQHNQQPQRSLSLNFTFPTDSEYEQFRDEIYRGSRGGANLICIAPTEMDDSVVILGRVRESIAVAKNTPRERTSQVEILEAPLPNDPDVAAVYDAPVTGGG